MASGKLERCSLHGWILVFTVSLHRVGEQFADVNLVDRVAHGGGGVLIWAGVCYGQRTQVHFIDGILNAQRHRDEILKTSQFLHGQHTHWTCRPLSMFGMLWIWHVYDTYTTACSCVCQYPATSHITAIEGEWINIPQATNNNLINSMRRRCEANGGHTRYWLVFWPAKLHISEWPFIVASLRHTCAIFILSNQHLDMIISAKEQCSLTQI